MPQDTQHNTSIKGQKVMHPNDALRKAREQRAWTQQALADQLGATALTINRWEQGKCAPRSHFRMHLCDLFQLTAQELGLEDLAVHQPEAQADNTLCMQESDLTSERDMPGKQTLVEAVDSLLADGDEARIVAAFVWAFAKLQHTNPTAANLTLAVLKHLKQSAFSEQEAELLVDLQTVLLATN